VHVDRKRVVRFACCAAASERGRPIVIGSTTPGKSTVLRTGTMMIASGGTGGNGGAVPGADVPGAGAPGVGAPLKPSAD
jgi:hypothetical protein